MRWRDQARDYFQSSWSRKHCIARLELTDFELHCVFFGFANVRRIGCHEIESAGTETSQQIGVVKMNPLFELVTSGVNAGDFERGGGNIGGVDFCIGELFGQRYGDAA